jgi:hypothetical protein
MEKLSHFSEPQNAAAPEQLEFDASLAPEPKQKASASNVKIF